MKACGNDKCSSSSGICGSMTFGSGKLDPNGYWENPCEICEEDFHKRNPNFHRTLDRLEELNISYSKFINDLGKLAILDEDSAKLFVQNRFVVDDRSTEKIVAFAIEHLNGYKD